jgi:hypothetical protein
LVAIAVLLVIGVTIGATLLFTRDGDGSSTPPTSDVPSDIASADDTGPVEIITEEPTCEAFISINDSLGDVQRSGWSDLRSSLPRANEWTADQRTQVEAVATATRNASDKVSALAKQTPNRVVRELYEQFIAYGRAYADSIRDYIPQDDALATANINASSALFGICESIRNGSTNRGLSVQPAAPPTGTAPLGDLNNPKVLVNDSNSAWCSEWNERIDRITTDTAEWEKLDSSVPATQWSPERRMTELAVRPMLADFAEDIEQVGRASDNPILEDFTVTAALYFRAYASVGDNYVSADSWLSYIPFRLTNLISSACLSSNR